MARATIPGTATVVTAKENAPQYGPEGESTFIDLITDRFDSTSWELQLEVRAEGKAAYTVSGTYSMPSRVHTIRRSLNGPPRLAAGVVLPVTVDVADPQRIEILWKELARSGGTAQLYGEQFSVRSLIDDVRSAVTPAAPSAPPSVAPTSPRPTAETYPPIGGVDFDTYIAAVLPVARGELAAADVIAHYEANGFPAGRVPEIAQAWVERASADPVLDEWYRYLTQT